jgi:hypothetical protein
MIYYRLFIPRTFVSLLISITYIHNKKLNNNILLINTKFRFKKKIIELLIPYLNKIFYKIYYINYSEIKHKNYNYKNILINTFNKLKKNESDKILRKLCKYNFKEIYGGGNLIEETFKNNLKGKISFFYIEQGIGNIISFTKQQNIKNKLIYFFFRVFHLLKITNYYPIIYKKYIGLFCGTINKKIFINGVRTGYYKIKNYNNTIKNLAKITEKYIELENYSKKPVFLNFQDLTIRNNNDFEELRSRVFSLINKSEMIFMKMHPNNKNYVKTIDYFRKFFKTKKINFYLVKKNIYSSLPIEIFIEKYKVKKIISTISAVPFYSSLISPKNKNYVFLDYSFKYPVSINLPELSIENKKLYIKYFNKINFI